MDALWVKNFVDNALSSTVFKISAFLCFAIFAKNWNIQNGRYVWRDKNFLKIGMATPDTLWVIKVIEIALSSTVFKM